MLDAFILHINKSFPFLKKEKFFIACSGGLDSIVLTVLAHELKLNFAVAHCNFRLRGKESDDDEEFVRDFSEKIGVPFYVKQFNTKKEIENRGGSLQMVARDLRYEWFFKLLQTHDYSYLLTAHHTDDSLETFLINLSRGTGINGLTGIPEQNGSVIRPLLPFSRKEIKDYAISNQISWREDSSNKESKYLRNHTRHNVIPQLKELSPSFLENFLNTQKRLQETSTILENLKKELQKSLFLTDGEIVKISIEKLQKLEPLQSYLYLLFNEYGFTAWKDILNLLSTTSGKEICSNTHRLVKDRDFILLTNLGTIDNTSFFISESDSLIETPIHLKIEKVEVIIDTHKNCVYLDMEKLNYPLEVRKKNNGDYFHPIGMKGKKKLSKYLKDEKVNTIAKEKQWLLCSNEAIVWVVGKRADERFKVDKKTKQIVKITWQE